MSIPPNDGIGSQASCPEVRSGKTKCDADVCGVQNVSVPEEFHDCDGNAETKSAKATVVEYINAFIVAVVLAAFIMTFVARSFLVQGCSMEPSLHHGERLLVNRFIYRFKEPERGDIIVFRYPGNPRQMFIKRVIGVPGDEVMITGGVVYINGVGLTEPYIAERAFREYGPALVPHDRVFVLGDNRNNSQDSTDESVGMVPFNAVLGKAFLVYWPLNRMGTCKKPSYPQVLGVPGSEMATAPGTP